ncbi:MAG TPA: lipocalin-like domain-containing protein [Dongiaceae bacterium]|nr:lipocalin-like domain-containing protein [Dongiaceae bacterium]
MRSRHVVWFGMLILAWPAVGQYQQATPGYHYEFPRDHFNHEGFQTEWWYYTGNVTAEDGHRFGFELTFFRQGVDRSNAKPDTWAVEDIYLAHLALSDIDGSRFYHQERTNRAGPGIAGISATEKRIWNGNWSASWEDDQQRLEATQEQLSFSLFLDPEKPPVIHGENGISQKAAGSGHASHYTSLTRLNARGTITVEGRNYAISGLAWMDHEFFTEQLAEDQAGWDWISAQLGDGTELMLYRMRKKDGAMDSFSSGTFVDTHGRASHLRGTDFSMIPGRDVWKSAETGAVYPIQWSVSVPKLGLQLEVRTQLKQQELASRSGAAPSYWEGAVEFRGRQADAAVDGVGYLEMTGYDRPVALGNAGRSGVSR